MDSTDECNSNPCENNGTCVDRYRGYHCICDGTGFSGPNCSEREFYIFIDTTINNREGPGTCGDIMNMQQKRKLTGNEDSNITMHDHGCLKRLFIDFLDKKVIFYFTKRRKPSANTQIC